jgi:Na+-transporting NADH:ubiquinone oxidoreductase subunit A
MGRTIKIKKGLDIKLAGTASKEITTLPLPEIVSIKPTDFNGVAPKMLVQPGDEVLAGSPLFFDKNNENVKFCSPVSGEVVQIVRGEKRQIREIRILADREIRYVTFTPINPDQADRERVLFTLLNSGVWPLIRQRPFGIIPDPGFSPKSIFISAFDSNPLAPDTNFVMQHAGEEFQTGLDTLKKLTDGKIYLNIKAGEPPAPVFANAKGVELNSFSGPHPAGNVGVQIHHLDPVNKGEVVWCIHPQDVLIIGRLLTKGIFDASRIIALTGEQVIHPKYYHSVIGASVKHILEDAGLKEGARRIISGNVLTGKQITAEDCMDFYDTQITVIPEGNRPEFMGWLKPGLNKFSVSRAFLSWLQPQKIYHLDTNMHGEERPFVMSGQYEQVLPMDIYPVHLLKSILAEDIELMENLGIYEVVEEDLALCEFVCTSKIESQQILRKGLDLVRKELS